MEMSRVVEFYNFLEGDLLDMATTTAEAGVLIALCH
jgi:hypothetical protein